MWRLRRQVELRRDQPVETPFGRKRQIDQSACNKDYSCLKGFCPSFVTVEGGELIRGFRASSSPAIPAVPGPARAGTALAGAPVVDPGHRHRRHRRRDRRSYSRHGGASRGQGLGHDRHGRAVAEERCGRDPSQAGPPGRRTSPPSASRPVAPISSSAAIWSPAPPSACSPPPAEPAPRRSSTPTRPCRPSSPAIPISKFRPTRWGCRSRRGPAPAPPHSSTPPRLRPRCLATPSPPISSPSVSPGSRAWCRWVPRRSRRRSSSMACRSR